MAERKGGSQLEDLIKPGQVIAGKYRVIKPLGAGNFAYVLQGQHEVMGRDVALKILKPEVIRANPEVSERFLTEVRIVSRLKCPNTVTVFDFGETTDGLLYMVLEHVDGVGLDQVLKTGSMEPERAVKIVVQILKSLDEAHAMGVVHRDLKPGNVMLTKTRDSSDYVKVLDFGVAKLMTDDDEDDDEPTSSGLQRRSTQFIGTPIYMSPEQVLGRKVSAESDFYSLGLILYEMLTGESPIDSSLNVAAVAQLHIDFKPLPFPSLETIPPMLRAAILKATSRKPEDRFSSAREFARAIRADSTGDFKQYVDQPKAPRPKSDRKAAKRQQKAPVDEASPFSGKNYVDIPESGAPEVVLPRTRKIESGVNPAMKRAKSSLELSTDLQVDIGKVRREEIARKRQQRETWEKQTKVGRSGRDYGWMAGGFVAFFVGFFFFSAMFDAAPVVRFIIGVSPVFVSVLFAAFSSVRKVHGDVVGRWVVPVSRDLSFFVLGSLIIASLGWPGTAAQEIEISGEWFIDGIPGLGIVLKPVGMVICGSLHAWFEFMAAATPW